MTALQTLYTDIYRKLLETIRSIEDKQRVSFIQSCPTARNVRRDT